MGYIELKTGQVALRGKAKPPTGWIEESLPFSANAITFGDGKFVIVGEDSKFAYSTDGITWTTTAAFNSAQSPFSAVTYGDGKFVAVAKSNYDDTAYSTDGINWTLGKLPFASDWRGITYGNGKFVAVSRQRKDDKDAAYSTDGINWTAIAAAGFASHVESVAYGNGTFVTFGELRTENRSGFYSTDGINWNTTTLPYVPITTQYTDITFGNGKFVAMSNDYFSCLYSNDGITWNTMTMPHEQSMPPNWYAVTYGNDKFVAVAKYSNGVADKDAVCAYSTDGINWTEMSMPKAASWPDIVYGNGKFVAIAGTTSAYWYVNA